MKVGTEKFGGIRSIFPALRDFTARDSFAAKMVSDFRNRGFNGLGCVPSSELGSIEAHAVGRPMEECGHDRSEERRVRQECVSKCRCRWSAYTLKKKTKQKKIN